MVTHHGRPRVVIVSAHHFQELTEAQEATPAQDMASYASRLSSVLEHASEAFFALDAALHVTATNGAFTSLVGRAESEIAGRSWRACFPDVAQSVVEEQFVRVIRAGEAVAFEMAAGLSAERLFAVRAFPYAGGVAALMVNCTHERLSQAHVHESAALRHALAALPSIASAQLNVRGVLTSASEQLSRLSGFTSAELSHVRLTDILSPRDRASVARALEGVYEGGQTAQLSTAMLTKGGREVDVDIAVAAISGGGSAEALYVVISTGTASASLA